MYSESNNTEKTNIQNPKLQFDLDLNTKVKLKEDMKMDSYIIPYNESYEYVFISEIINTLKLKTKLHNIKKYCITKKWFQKQQLDHYKYAIHFSCNDETMKLIKDELVIRQLWIIKLEEEHINQLTNNQYFNQ